jgi:hypothetical protein
MCGRCYEADRVRAARERRAAGIPPRPRKIVPTRTLPRELATTPTNARPGSAEKITVLTARAEWREEMHLPGDFGFTSGYLSLLRFVRLDQSA